MHILITGVKGMLGSAVQSFLQNKNITTFGIHRNKTTSRSSNSLQIDLTNDQELNQLEVLKNKIDIVIHCAANVNVNECEENKLATHNLHVESSKKLAQLFPNSKFVYISTDSVYDGVNGDFSEESIPDPKNYYAKTKLEGEHEVLKYNPNSYILRTNIYGYKRPFSGSLFEWAYTSLFESKDISGYSNVFFNPLYVDQLAEIIYLMIDKNVPRGIYNIAGSEIISKYEFANKIKKLFNFKASISPIEIPGLHEGVPRPLNTTLNTDKIAQYINMEKYSVTEGLKSIKIKLNNAKN